MSISSHPEPVSTVSFAIDETTGGKFLLTEGEFFFRDGNSWVESMEDEECRLRHLTGYNLFCCNDSLGLLFSAIDTELFVSSMERLEARYQDGELGDAYFSVSPETYLNVHNFGSSIRHLGLSSSGRFLSITTSEKVEVFESFVFLPQNYNRIGGSPKSYKSFPIALPMLFPTDFVLQWHKTRDLFLLAEGRLSVYT
jgi:hypothetical protein